MVPHSWKWVIELLQMLWWLITILPLLLESLIFRHLPLSSIHLDQHYGAKPHQIVDLVLPRTCTVSSSTLRNSHAPSEKLRPLMIFLHGGAWAFGWKWMHSLMPRLLERLSWNTPTSQVARIGDANAATSDPDAVAAALQGGVIVALPRITLYPHGDVEDMLEDLHELMGWIVSHAAKYGGDASRVFLAGYSSGGHLAALLLVDKARRPNRGSWDLGAVRGFYGIAAPYHIADHYKHEQKRGVAEKSPMKPAMKGHENFDFYSPAHLAEAEAKQVSQALEHVDFVFIHGEKDKTVPVSSSRRFASALANAGIPNVVLHLTSADHVEMVLPAPFQSQLENHHLLLRIIGDSIRQIVSRLEGAIVPVKEPEPPKPVLAAPGSSRWRLLCSYKPPPTQYEKELAEAYELAWASVTKGEDDGWIPNGGKKDVEFFYKAIPGFPINASKGVGLINAPAGAIRDVFGAFECKKRWDRGFNGGSVLEQLGPLTRVTYTCTKSPSAFISPRDMVLISRMSFHPDGSIFVVSTSITHPQAPPKSGYVRCELKYSGILFSPINKPGTPDVCRIVFTGAVDPKGYIPAVVVNKVSVEQLLCIANVRNLMLSDPTVMSQALANAQILEAQVTAAAEADMEVKTPIESKVNGDHSCTEHNPARPQSPVPVGGDVASQVESNEGKVKQDTPSLRDKAISRAELVKEAKDLLKQHDTNRQALQQASDRRLQALSAQQLQLANLDALPPPSSS